MIKPSGTQTLSAGNLINFYKTGKQFPLTETINVEILKDVNVCFKQERRESTEGNYFEWLEMKFQLEGPY